MNKNVLTIGMVVGAFISILSFRSDSVQAQNNSYWSINREQYFTGEWTVQNFPCPDKKRYTAPVRITTNNNYVEGIALTNIPCLPTSQKVFAVRLDVGSIGYDQVFQSTIYNSKTYYNTNTGSVATLRIVSQNSFNINASKPPVKFTRSSSIKSESDNDAQPDYSACSYYDEVARTNNCKYHARAAKICNGKDRGVNLFTKFCSGVAPGKISESEKNCIRSCLVKADQLARTQPECQVKCDGETCTRKSCIDKYHNTCFESCGVSKWCFAGDIFPYPNDDKKCLISLNNGICLVKSP